MWNTFDKNKETLKLQYNEHNWRNGLSNEELEAGVKEMFAGIDDSEFVKVKADATAFVMRNAQIDLHPNEFFFDKINYNECLDRVHFPAVERLKRNECKEAYEKSKDLQDIIAIVASMDFSHIAPDWNTIISKGIVGIIEMLEEARRENADDAEKVAFYDNSLTVYRAFIDMMLRMAELAEEMDTPTSRFAAKNLRALTVSAPKTLPEALQLSILYYNIQTFVECVRVRSLGGLDTLFYPLYKSDIESGRYTDEQEREMLRDFFWKISAKKVCANLPFYIGGRKADGKDKMNPFTRVLLEEYRNLDIYDPKIHVMYHKDMDQSILDLVLEMIREGKSSFLLLNLDVAEESLRRIGIKEEHAKKVIVYGCYEGAAEGTEIPCTTGGNVNISHAVLFTLFNGIEPLTGKKMAPETGTDFATFDSFYDAVKEQVTAITRACMDTIAAYEPYYYKIWSAPLMSATYESCMRKGKDAYLGGAEYNNTSVVGAGIGTLADSVAAIKKAVYDEKKYTLDDFRAAIKDNWEGHDELLRYVMQCPKFGNNDPEADVFSTDFMNYYADIVNNKPNGRGGVFRAGFFSIDWKDRTGLYMAATPDGRRAGTPISKNACPNVGQDKKGVTAIVNSLLKFDWANYPDGCVADLVLHSSAVKGDDGMAAFKGLLTAFMLGGGYAVHFNVLNPDVLRKAQADPDKYRNLQIRLCGWNVYFVDLKKADQDDFIIQSTQRS